MEDPKGRLLATTGLALVGLAILELIGTVAIGLSVKSSRIGFITKQGYAFLTQLEKSPLALMLVGGALLAALITYRAETDERTKTLARLALWAALVAAVVLGVLLGSPPCRAQRKGRVGAAVYGPNHSVRRIRTIALGGVQEGGGDVLMAQAVQALVHQLGRVAGRFVLDDLDAARAETARPHAGDVRRHRLAHRQPATRRAACRGGAGLGV